MTYNVILEVPRPEELGFKEVVSMRDGLVFLLLSSWVEKGGSGGDETYEAS